MAEIEFKGVTKRYPDGTEAVTELDLHIADGEFMILVGPSGCGKTTALRMIAGLEDITEGTLRIGEKVVNHLQPKDRDIAMVFQNYALYPHMTVRQNMGFALRLARVEKSEIKRRVEEAAAILDLVEHLDRKPANLSGGQRQRVAMGRAIVRDPQAFLMDEPLSNLDAKLRVQTRTAVARLQRRLSTTMVFVTHDQTEAMTLGDRVAVMRGGLIQQIDTPQRLYDDPANVFVAGFIGSPPMNLLPGELSADSVKCPLGELPLPPELRNQITAPVQAGKVIVGIRPQAFEDAALESANALAPHLRVKIDVVESMGAELYAYFDVQSRSIGSSEIERLVESTETVNLSGDEDVQQVVARLSASSRASAGQEAELTIDPSALKLFDGQTGERLGKTAPSSEELSERSTGTMHQTLMQGVGVAPQAL